MNILPRIDMNRLKNIGKSTKYIAIEDVKNASPAIFDSIEVNRDLYNDIRKDVTFNRKMLKRVKSYISNTELAGAGRELVKNAKSSWKTGNFYDRGRAEKADNAMFKNMGLDFDLNSDFGEDLNSAFNDNSDKQDDSMKSLDAMADGLNDIDDSIEIGSKKTVDAINNSSSMSYIQNSKLMAITQAGMNALNQNVKTLVEFTSTNLNSHLKNASSFFTSTTSLLTEQNKMLKELLEMQRNLYNNARESQKQQYNNRYNNVVGYGGSVDVSKYASEVKKNFMNSTFMAPLTMLWDMRDQIISNPLQFLLSSGMDYIGGDKLKQSINKFQTSLSGVFSKYLDKMKKWKYQDGIRGILGSLLSLDDSDKIDKIDTSKFNKGAMQFNGITQKSIVEVIPAYLARIESALTGQSERFYNMSSGRWTTLSSVRNKFNSIMKDNKSGIMKNTFGHLVSTLDKVGSYNGQKISKKDRDAALNEILSAIQKREGDFLVGNNVEEFLKSLNINFSKNKSKLAIANAFRELLNKATDSSELMTLSAKFRENKGKLFNLQSEISNANYGDNGGMLGEYAQLAQMLVNGSTNGSSNVKYALSKYSNTATKKYIDKSDFAKLSKLFKVIPNNATTKSNKLTPNFSSNIVSSSLNNIEAAPVNANESLLDMIRENDVLKIVNDNSKESKDFIKYIKNLKSVTDFKMKDRNVQDYIKYISEKYYDDSTLPSNDYFVRFIKYIRTPSNKNKASATSNYFKLDYSIRRVVDGIYEKTHIDNEKLYTSKDIINYARKTKYLSASSLSNNNLAKYKGKNLLEKLKNDDNGAVGKLKIIRDYAKALASAPMDLLTATITNVDRYIYQAFFGVGNIKDESGKPIKGFLEKIRYEIRHFLDSFTDYLKERFIGSGKFKEGFKEGFGNAFRTFADSTKEAYKGIKEDANYIINGKSGGGFVPRTGLYMLSKGEQVISSEDNPNNPNRNTADIRKDKEKEKNVGRKLGISVVHGYASGTNNKNDKESIDREEIESYKEKHPFLRDWDNDSIINFIKNKKRAIHVLDNYSNEVNHDKRKKSNSKNKKNKKEDDKDFKSHLNKEYSKAWDDIKKRYPGMIGEGAFTGTLGFLALGPVGLLLGSAFGASNYLLKNSKTINKVIFGDSKKLSIYSRTASGLRKMLPDRFLKWFDKKKENANDVKKYGLAGGAIGVASAFLGGPIGIFGGLALGGLTAYLKNNEKARRRLFGDDITDSKFSKWISKKKGWKALALGGAAGFMYGGPFGLIGGLAIGGMYNYLKNNQKVQEYLFGVYNVKTNKYEGGLLPKIANKAVAPLSKLADYTSDYLRKAIFQPLYDFTKPFVKQLQVMTKSMYKMSSKILSSIVEPGLKMPFWKQLDKAMNPKTKKGKFLIGSLGGGAAGFMYGGLPGAIIGGAVGGAARLTGLDKVIGKAGLKIGKLPGKMASFVGNRIRSHLIQKGNADDMSASERLNFIDEHNLSSYSGEEGERRRYNDEALKNANADQLKQLSFAIEIIRESRKGNKANFKKISAKVVDIVKSDKNISFSDSKKIIDIIRKILKLNPETDGEIMQEYMDSIFTIIRLGPGTIKQKNSTIKALRKTLPIIIGVDTQNKFNEKNIKNLVDEIENGEYGVSYRIDDDISDSELEKSSNYINKELSVKDESHKAKTPQEMLVESTNTGNQLLQEQNKSLSYILASLAGYSIDKSILSQRMADAGINFSLIKSEALDNSRTAATIAMQNVKSASGSSRDNMIDAKAADIQLFNRLYGTNFKIDEKTANLFANNENISKLIHPHGLSGTRDDLQSTAAEFVANSPNMDKDTYNRIKLASKLVPNISKDVLSQIANNEVCPGSVWNNRIKPLLRRGFNLSNVSEIADMDQDEFNKLLKVTKKYGGDQIRDLSQEQMMSNFSNVKDEDLYGDISNRRLFTNNGKFKSKLGLYGTGALLGMATGGLGVIPAIGGMVGAHLLDKVPGYYNSLKRTLGIGTTAEERQNKRVMNILNGNKDADNNNTTNTTTADNTNTNTDANTAGGPDAAGSNDNIPKQKDSDIGIKKKLSKHLSYVWDSTIGKFREFNKNNEGKPEATNSKMNADAEAASEKKESRWKDMLKYYSVKVKEIDFKAKAKKGISAAYKYLKNTPIGQAIAALFDMFKAVIPGAGLIGDLFKAYSPDLKHMVFTATKKAVTSSSKKLLSWSEKLGTKNNRAARGVGKILGKFGGFLGGLYAGSAEAAEVSSNMSDAESQAPQDPEKPIESYMAQKLAGISAGIVGIAKVIGSASYDSSTSITDVLGKGGGKGGKGKGRRRNRRGKGKNPKVDYKGGVTAIEASTKAETELAKKVEGEAAKKVATKASTKLLGGAIAGGTVAATGVGVYNALKGGAKDGVNIDEKGMKAELEAKEEKATKLDKACDKAMGNKEATASSSSSGFFSKAKGKVSEAFMNGKMWIAQKFDAVWEVIKKYLPDCVLKYAEKISGVLKKIVVKISSSPKILLKLGAKVAGSIVTVAISAYAFYQGYNNNSIIQEAVGYSKQSYNAKEKSVSAISNTISDLTCGLISVGDIGQWFRFLLNDNDKNGSDSDTSTDGSKTKSNNSKGIGLALNKIQEASNKILNAVGAGSDNSGSSSASNNNGNNSSPAPNSNNGGGSSPAPKTGGGEGIPMTPERMKTYRELMRNNRNSNYPLNFRVNRSNPVSSPFNPSSYNRTMNNAMNKFYNTPRSGSYTINNIKYNTSSNRIGDGGNTAASNASYIWNYLVNSGYSEFATAGIMGNIKQESQFNQGAVNPNGGAYGICQWFASRKDDLIKNRPNDYQTLDGQLAFLIYELNGSKSNVRDELKRVGTPEDAAFIFHRDFEISEDSAEQVRATRGKYARMIYDKGKGKGSKTTAKDFEGVAEGTVADGGASSSGSSANNGGIFGKISSILDKSFKKFSFLGGDFGFNLGNNSKAGGSRSTNTSAEGIGPIETGSAAAWVYNDLKQGDPGTQVTSEYGKVRSDTPVPHGGIDMGANVGTPVHTPVSGKVIDVNTDGSSESSGGGYGKYVQVAEYDANGNVKAYHMFPHMSDTSVNKGDNVKKGDQVGLVGSTGHSSGPHLHYEIDPPDNMGAVKDASHFNPGQYMLSNSGLADTQSIDGSKSTSVDPHDGHGGGDSTVPDSEKGYVPTKVTNPNKLVNKYVSSDSNGALADSISKMTESNNDFSDKLDKIIDLLGVIATALQAGMPSNNTAVLASAGGNARQPMKPGLDIMDIMKSMMNIATR